MPFYLLSQVETVTTGLILDEIKKASANGGQSSAVIYLFVLVIVLFAVGGFILLRYVLTHAKEIHSEANRTLLEISAKHETRCESLTKAFSTECAQLRQVILRTMSDARDMVHAARDIAGVAVSGKELLEMYRKREEELKAKSDRDQSLSQTQA